MGTHDTLNTALDIAKRVNELPAPYRFYKLVDPRDSSIRYIGQTRQALTTRLKGHVRDTYRQDGREPTKKNLWLQELLQSGYEPNIIPLEEVILTKSEADDREIRWIYYHWQRGHQLTNTIHTDLFIRSILERDPTLDVFISLDTLFNLRHVIAEYHMLCKMLVELPYDLSNMLHAVRENMEEYTKPLSDTTRAFVLSLLDDDDLYRQFHDEIMEFRASRIPLLPQIGGLINHG